MKNTNSNITIYDVAEKAGVSAATVSRVINHFEQVTHATRRKVLAAMDELEFDLEYYRETTSKRGTLNSKRTKIEKEQLFILSIPSLTNIFFIDVIDGAESAAKKNGHHLLVDNTPITEDNISYYCTFLKKLNVSGIITTSMLSTTLLQQLQEAVPIVQCSEYNSELNDISYVGINDTQAAYQATKFFLSKGFSKVAYFSTPLSHQFAIRRKRGYLRALEEANIPLSKEWILELPHSHIEHSIHYIEQWLQANHPDFIFCGSDYIAGATLKAAKNLNINVPEDISVMGFDDISLAAGSLTSISSIQQPKYALGYNSFELLLKEIQNPSSEKKHLLLPTKMIFRESTRIS